MADTTSSHGQACYLPFPPVLFSLAHAESTSESVHWRVHSIREAGKRLIWIGLELNSAFARAFDLASEVALVLSKSGALREDEDGPKNAPKARHSIDPPWARSFATKSHPFHLKDETV